MRKFQLLTKRVRGRITPFSMSVFQLISFLVLSVANSGLKMIISFSLTYLDNFFFNQKLLLEITFLDRKFGGKVYHGYIIISDFFLVSKTF